MTGRRALVGLSLLCALAFTAFSAASASAATSGTTPVTCVDTGATNNGDYTDAHCDTTGTKGASRYSHVAAAAETAVTATNAATKNSTAEATKPVLEAVVGGINTKLEAATVSTTGTAKKQLTGEVHETIGSNIVITYTGVTVVNPLNCTVNSPGQPAGTVKTATLKSAPVAGGMNTKFEPAAGTEFTKFEFKGASCAINTATPTVTGTVTVEPSGQHAAVGGVSSAGATVLVNVTKASAQLKVGGQNALLNATETAKGENGNPLASTEPIA